MLCYKQRAQPCMRYSTPATPTRTAHRIFTYHQSLELISYLYGNFKLVSGRRQRLQNVFGEWSFLQSAREGRTFTTGDRSLLGTLIDGTPCDCHV